MPAHERDPVAFELRPRRKSLSFPICVRDWSTPHRVTVSGKLFRQFLVRLGVPAALDEEVPLERRESKYAVGEVFVSLLYAVFLDLKRQSDTILLRLDQVFQQIAGLRG